MKKTNYKTLKTLQILLTFNFALLTCFSAFSQGAAINTTGVAADASAGLDIQFNNKGLLIPRITTNERNVITNPAEGLQIYNLDCHNFEYFNGTSWVAVNPIVASLSINANPSGAVCAGTNVVFTAIPVNGGAMPIYKWKLNGVDVGTNSATFTNSSLNNGDQISCELTSNAACVSGNPAISNVLSMIVSAPPTIADAGADIIPDCGVTTATLAANSPTVGIGSWSVVSGTASITNSTSPISGVTGLAVPGTATLRWTISNSPCSASTDDVIITVYEPPTVANAGSDINPACGVTTATLAGNTPTVGTGSWSVVSGTAAITTPSSPTSSVTGLAVDGTATLRWTISNSPCADSYDDVVITTTYCLSSACGTVTFTYNGLSVTYGTVNGDYNSGQYCWLDRNLGATAVATTHNHSDGYGDLFQWGRLDDAHQKRNSTNTSTLSSNDVPGHANFILAPNSPYDWRSPQSGALWQGVSGINNPCPAGWRLPSETELNNERTSWVSNDYNGAIASPLKLTAAGYRFNGNGLLYDVGSYGYYWSAVVSGASARYLTFGSSNATMNGNDRANGMSVRCLKD